jgi:HlyD family secretion protein
VQNVITYDAVIGVSNTDLKLFPGMTANVKILIDHRSGVLLVPNAALRYHPASETAQPAAVAKGVKGITPEQAVWLLDTNNKTQRSVLTIGQTDGKNTEVTSGTLKEGDRLIIAAIAPSASASAATPKAPTGKGPGF